MPEKKKILLFSNRAFTFYKFRIHLIKQLLEDIGTESTETIKTNLIENINTFTNKIFLDDITFIIIKHNEIKKVLT